MKFRHKPTVIDAFKWTPGCSYPAPAFNDLHLVAWVHGRAGASNCYLAIRTLEGIMRAQPGDWIIKGVNGEFYPCKPDVFAKTYELAEPFTSAEMGHGG